MTEIRKTIKALADASIRELNAPSITEMKISELIDIEVTRSGLSFSLSIDHGAIATALKRLSDHGAAVVGDLITVLQERRVPVDEVASWIQNGAIDGLSGFSEHLQPREAIRKGYPELEEMLEVSIAALARRNAEVAERLPEAQARLDRLVAGANGLAEEGN
jgi:hypothetical protein